MSKHYLHDCRLIDNCLLKGCISIVQFVEYLWVVQIWWIHLMNLRWDVTEPDLSLQMHIIISSLRRLKTVAVFFPLMVRLTGAGSCKTGIIFPHWHRSPSWIRHYEKCPGVKMKIVDSKNGFLSMSVSFQFGGGHNGALTVWGADHPDKLWTLQKLAHNFQFVWNIEPTKKIPIPKVCM